MPIKSSRILCVPAILWGLFSVPAANAATLVLGSGGPNYSEMLFGDGSSGSTSISLISKPGDYIVDLITLGGQNMTINGQGFAFVKGPFTDLTIDPRDPVIGFTAFGFNLDPGKIGKISIGKGKYTPTQMFDISIAFTNGSSQLFSTGYAPNTKFDLLADTGEVMQSIRLFNPTWSATDGKTIKTGTGWFDNIRQMSFDPAFQAAVPEPQTWAMMILGFGAIGGAMRRRRAVGHTPALA